MTRINCVDPEELTRNMLIAEYRELPRIFGLVRAASARGETPEDRRNPRRYTLGTGHCRFFYSRLAYLVRRQQELIDEMRRRGYRANFNEVERLLDGIDPRWCGDWTPDQDAIAINRQRIAERGGENQLAITQQQVISATPTEENGMSEAYASSLQSRHDDLERQIAEELKHPQPDDIRVHQLKKEKLKLKERLMGIDVAT